jgi:16S rRNA (adenine1518-N6/adenine1519-N6)-dimethyltransferase
VDSEVIVLDPLPPEQCLSPDLARAVESLLRQAFAARRKMLRNTLAGLAPPEELLAWAARAGVDLAQRPQDLSPERWIALAQALPS